MTKERYLEMCELMGSTPKEEEIPIELSDLPPEIRLALALWQSLPDDVDYFNGNYFGKQLHFYRPIFELFEIPKEDYLCYYNWVSMIDRIKTKKVQSKKSSADNKVKASPV